MSSLVHGNNTSEIEVTNISAHGIWILAHDKELFMSYDDFPWFIDQPVKKIFNVEEPSAGHLYWPDLDVDLRLEMIEHPDRYPLKSNYK